MTPQHPPYSLPAALEYFSMLAADIAPPELQAPEGLPTQPTIGPEAAALLDMLVRCLRPARILDIGTSWGYSAAVLGRAAASYGGQVLSLEQNPALIPIARDNLARIGLEKTVTVQQADTRIAVPELRDTFGLILQDGGKMDYPPLLAHLVFLLEPGGLLITDDVLFPVMEIPAAVRHWQVAVAEYNQALAAHPGLQTVWLPIGDGIALSRRIILE